MNTPKERKSAEFITPGSQEVVAPNLGLEIEAKSESGADSQGLDATRENLDQQPSSETVPAIQESIQSVPVARTEQSVTPLPTELEKGEALANLLNGNREVNSDNAADIMNEVIGQ
jgi:hypothetical protein